LPDALTTPYDNAKVIGRAFLYALFGVTVADVTEIEERRMRIVCAGAVAGLLLSIAGDILLFAAQRVLNWLVLHGFAGGIDALWTTGSGGPINIMASPVTFVLTAVAGVIAGISVGTFAAVLLTMSPHDSAGPGVAAEKPATSGTAG